MTLTIQEGETVHIVPVSHLAIKVRDEQAAEALRQQVNAYFAQRGDVPYAMTHGNGEVVGGLMELSLSHDGIYVFISVHAGSAPVVLDEIEKIAERGNYRG